MTRGGMVVTSLLACLLVAGAVAKTIKVAGFAKDEAEDLNPKHLDRQKAEGRGEACVEALVARQEKMHRIAAAGDGPCQLDPNDELNVAVKELCDEPKDKNPPCGFLKIMKKGNDTTDAGTEADLEVDAGDEAPNSRKKRLVVNNKVWNKGIVPYVIAAGEVQSIKRAMAVYERFTCLRFHEWYAGIENDLGIGHTAYIKFVNYNGCWSTKGRMWGGQETSCCGGTTCVHELGHALGAYHEHQNPRAEGVILNMVENVQSGYIHNYADVSENEGLSTGYDFNSVMHYEPWAFGNGNGDTIQYLFSDMPKGEEWYYLMQELSLATDCAGEFCSDSPLTCVNDGYLTLVDGACSCMCPPGLDPATGCATVLGQPEAGDVPEQRTQWTSGVSWPAGQFSLPAPASGCPGGFTDGSVSHQAAPRLECVDNDPAGCPYWGWSGCLNNPTFMYGTCPATCQRCHTFGSHQSEPNHLKDAASSDGVEHGFCTKAAGTGDQPWQGGNYCIYRQGGQCPEGFEAGSAKFLDTAHSDLATAQSGDTPDGEYGDSSTKFEFCCSKRGFQVDELILPTTEPFSLVKLGIDCQKVKGMNIYEGYTGIRSNGPAVLAGTQPVVAMDVNKNTYKIPYCYYVPEHMDCGSAIALTKDNPTASFSGKSGPDQMCNWIVKAPEGDRIVLNFDSSNIECDDSLGLRWNRPGQPAKQICGDNVQFRKSTTSIYNTLGVTFTTNAVGNSDFSATVSLISSDDLCYNTVDHGQTYAGKVNVTRNFRTCVPWAQTGHCHHSPFRIDYIDENLHDNYCRTPHDKDGLMPWCYYDAGTCARDYCDVCATEKKYDVNDGCAALAATGYCTSDPKAAEQCQLTCADSITQFPEQPAAKTVTCSAPGSMPDGDIVGEVKDTYHVGDRVTYKCRDSSSTREVRCLTTGTWTNLHFVCGECDDGWLLRDGSCYKLFEEKKLFWDAKRACQDVGAEMAEARNAEMNTFLKELSFWDGVWLAATDDATEGTWKWSNGDVLDYKNWKSGEPDNYYNEDCMYQNNNGQWQDQWCTREYKQYVCTKPSHEVTTCDDVADVCQNMYVNLPTVCDSQADFMSEVCRATCGLCSPVTCAVPPSSGHVILEDDVTEIKQGQSVRYKCEEASGVHYVSGEFLHGCGPDGQLTGAPLVCEGRNELVMDHRELGSSNAGGKIKENTAYVSQTPQAKIPVDGKIVRWEFYSHGEGEQALQVWRKAGSNTKYELVGQNVFTSPKAALTSISIAADQQIQVKAGDFLGIYYGSPAGGIKYFKCHGASMPDYKKKTWKLKTPVAAAGFTVGATKTFAVETKEQCRQYNFYAVIEPDA